MLQRVSSSTCRDWQRHVLLHPTRAFGGLVSLNPWTHFPRTNHTYGNSFWIQIASVCTGGIQTRKSGFGQHDFRLHLAHLLPEAPRTLTQTDYKGLF